MTDKKIRKVFVIDDWEEFKGKLNIATIDSQCVVADVLRVLSKYEVKEEE